MKKPVPKQVTPPKVIRPPIWGPAPYEDDDIRAIQALFTGTANAAQQRRALDWIINRAAGTYEEQFFPDNPRVTDYMLGRRSVGQQVIKLTKLKLGLVGKDIGHGREQR